MKPKYPIKEHWEKFKQLRHPETIAHIETLLDEEISREAFVISHSRICHLKTRKKKQKGWRSIGSSKKRCARDLYKFLTENNWIKQG